MSDLNQGALVREARERAGFPSQGAAARAAGIDQATYNLYENGKKLPGRESLIKLANAFGCRVDHLLGREPLPARAALDGNLPAAS